jgi:hypothetical protein
MIKNIIQYIYINLTPSSYPGFSIGGSAIGTNVKKISSLITKQLIKMLYNKHNKNMKYVS